MRKIQFYPTPTQKKYLNIWFGVYRYFYNSAKYKSEELEIYNYMTLEPTMRTDSKFTMPKKWEEIKIPPRIIRGAIKDYCSSCKTCFTHLKLGLITHFNINIKRKHQATQTLNLEKNCFGKNNILFPTAVKDFGKFIGKYKDKHNGKKRKIQIKDIKIDHDCRISYQYDKYYLLIPYLKTERKSNPKYSCIAIDSGIRTFQTGFCLDNQHSIEICKDINEKIKPLTDKIDLLTTKYQKFPKRFKKRKRIRARRRKVFEKINNKVLDLHWKTCSFLTDNYKHIIISDFKTKDLFKGKILRHVSKRSMSILSHFKFRERLKEKCACRGAWLFIVDESYTTKTCGNCGKINRFLGGCKNFNCPFCEYEADRDDNGGRNIGLKTLFS